MRYRFGGLIHGGAYFRNLMVLRRSNARYPQVYLKIHSEKRFIHHFHIDHNVFQSPLFSRVLGQSAGRARVHQDRQCYHVGNTRNRITHDLFIPIPYVAFQIAYTLEK